MISMSPYTSKGNTLVFAPASETGAAFLAQDLFKDDEGQLIIASAGSPLMQTVENREGNYAVRYLDFNEPVAPDFIDFFDEVPYSNIPQTIDSLFLFNKENSYDSLTSTVLYAAAYYAKAASDHINVEQICNVAQLFFAKPLGDEKEYSSRLDEIIMVRLTGVHIVGGTHKQIAKPNVNSKLANLWNPIRDAFKNEFTKANVAAKIADALRPYEDKCMLDESSKLLDLKKGNAALVITCPDYDSKNDKLFLAIMDKLFTALYAKNSEVAPRPETPLRVIIEECDNKPSLWRLASIVKSATRNCIKLDLHYTSVAAFRRKHGEYANEILEAFDSLAFLNPNEPAALQEIQLRTGLPAQELRRALLRNGWLFQRGMKPQHITASNNQEAA